MGICHWPVGIIDAGSRDIWSSVEKFYRFFKEKTEEEIVESR
jgi:hypothetical protein